MKVWLTNRGLTTRYRRRSRERPRERESERGRGVERGREHPLSKTKTSVSFCFLRSLLISLVDPTSQMRQRMARSEGYTDSHLFPDHAPELDKPVSCGTQ